MNSLIEKNVYCPYCGETLSVLLDEQEAESEYIEDCQVCCKPIVFTLTMSFDGDLSVSVRAENETF